jgi:hypothetical protein
MGIPIKTTLRRALKESEAVVRALRDGKHFLLLAPSSENQPIREARFVLRDLEFFLLPVREGQDRASIRPEFHSYLDGEPERSGGQVRITTRAVVTDSLMVMDGRQLRGLGAFHIWTDEAFSGRVAWDPKNPVFLLTCKAARIEPPFQVSWRPEYDKAGAWVTLADEDLPAATFEPVVPHKDYLKVGLDVKTIMGESQRNPVDLPAAATPAPPAASPPAAAKPAAPAPPPPPATPAAPAGS